MLTLLEFAFADASESAAIGLPPEEHGLVLCTDEHGDRLTLVGDADFVRTLQQAPRQNVDQVEVPPQKFELRLRGWPEDWAFRPSRPWRR
jgi:hypothetical protein